MLFHCTSRTGTINCSSKTLALRLYCCLSSVPLSSSSSSSSSSSRHHLAATTSLSRAFVTHSNSNSTTTSSNTNTTGIRNMTTTSFQAWRVEEQADGSFLGSEQTRSTADWTSDTDDKTSLIRVTHSSLNYKDALSASGNKGVTRKFPHTPGIDAAGYIVNGDKSDSDEKQRPVLVTGYDLGMNTDGGFGEYICVPKDWVVDMPSNWKDAPRTSMVYGTAGLTAGLLVHKLLTAGQAQPGQSVCVTGATGAVGSVAVELLSKLGFKVTAITGKKSQHEALLKGLGAQEILDRDALQATKKPMLKPVFDHAIDTVGGIPLAELLKQITPGGSVACCGLVAGHGLETTVLPFILRGINLLGVDSVEIPVELKAEIWTKLATDWSCPKTERMARDIGRHELDVCLKAFLKGESSGKIVLDHSLTKSSSSSSSSNL